MSKERWPRGIKLVWHWATINAATVYVVLHTRSSKASIASEEVHTARSSERKWKLSLPINKVEECNTPWNIVLFEKF
jgi:hypothetical protein